MVMILKFYDLKNINIVNFQTIFIVYKHSSIIMPKYDLDNEFNELRDIGIKRGFLEVVSGPMVRSSYRAEQALEKNNAGL